MRVAIDIGVDRADAGFEEGATAADASAVVSTVLLTVWAAGIVPRESSEVPMPPNSDTRRGDGDGAWLSGDWNCVAPKETAARGAVPLWPGVAAVGVLPAEDTSLGAGTLGVAVEQPLQYCSSRLVCGNGKPLKSG